jgi:prepilin-type N-terminal cleavage/methylation domain-containing protein
MSFLRNSSGYTFIELLIAITILGLVIPPFLALFSSSYKAISGSSRQTEAVNLCHERIESVKSTGCTLQGNLCISELQPVYSEDEIPGYPGLRRETSIQPFNFACANHSFPEPCLFVVEVTVYWNHLNNERSEKLAAIMSCPCAACEQIDLFQD